MDKDIVIAKNTIGSIVHGQIKDASRLPKVDSVDLTQLKSAAQVVLGVIGVLGLVTIALAVPTIAIAFNASVKLSRQFKKLTPRNQAKKIEKTFYYLRSSGYIRLQSSGSSMEGILTGKGRALLDKLWLKSIKISTQKEWNGLWWLVAADIPTREYKRSADMLRWYLKQLDFYPLQRTLWVYPYRPIETIAKITSHYDIQRFVTVIEAKGLDREDDHNLRSHFKRLKLI